MNKVIQLAVLALLLTGCNQLSDANKSNAKKSSLSFENIPVNYPNTQKDTSVVDDYHGKSVADPYRWLEDDNAETTKNWVVEQNKATFGYLDNIPYRDAIEERLEK
ncbi:MAG: S9 family peptidase, partial [Bacteroidota bacterium]